MAIGVVFDGVGVTADQYHQVIDAVTNNGTDRPQGLISHHAGPTERGYCIIEVWESMEALQAIFEGRLAQAMAAANVTVQPKMFEVVNSM